jgi:hypothetical protein
VCHRRQLELHQVVLGGVEVDRHHVAGAGGEQRQGRAPPRADHHDGVVGAGGEAIDLQRGVLSDLGEEEAVVDGAVQGGASDDDVVGHGSKIRT